jgi:ABC-type nitrate/sulfonate/bicarbonate transport system substrate-binding protein
MQGMHGVFRSRLVLAAALVATLAVAACSGSSSGSGKGSGSAASSASSAPVSAVSSAPASSSSAALPAAIRGISAARCAENRAAGKIIFLTPFQYAASVGILDVLAAQQQGYFAALCLNVDIKPGGVNAALVSSGKAQLGGVGGPSDAITAAANGAKIVGIATYGNTSAIELLTLASSGITTLKDFEGKTLGYKGAMPPLLEAMFAKAGVPNSKIKEISVGYDPTILPKGQVKALVAYKSNEQLTLQGMGVKLTIWDPAKYGLRSAFNTQIANAAFAKAHPTAIEDFLRASYAGFAYSNAHLQTVLAYAAKLTGGGNYDIAASTLRWHVESKLVTSTLLAGHGVGWQTTAQWTPELGYLQQFKLISKPVDLATLIDNSYNQAIYNGTVLKPVSSG